MKKILILVFFLFSCEKEPQVQKLVIDVNPVDGGTVSQPYGEFQLNERVVISAKPNLEFNFVKWSGDINSEINQKEIFGPIVSLNYFDNEKDVINSANNTNYGLSASIFTNNLNRAHRVANLIDAGTIWINTWLLRDLRVPFGGMKHSGIGREGGIDSLHFFTESKNVCVKYE